ncbi:MAG: ATP-binding protein [Chloroflexota bacterium]
MRSITGKLILAFLAVSVLGTILVAFVTYGRAQNEFRYFVTRGYEQNLVRQLTFYYQAKDSWDNIDRVMARQRNGNRWQDLPSDSSSSSDGNANRTSDVANSPSRRLTPVHRRFQSLLADTSGIILVGNEERANGSHLTGAEIRRATPIIVNEEVVGLLLVNPPSDLLQGQAERFFLTRFGRAVILGTIGGTALALLLGILLARTLTEPLKELKEATQSIAAGDLGGQVSVHSKDELGALADSFNSMSLQLQQSNQLRQQMTADIAHDLRTPLSLILGYTEALHDGKLDGTPEMYETLHRQANHLSRLVDDLRVLSLADAGELLLKRQMIHPQQLLEQAVMAHQGKAAEKQITLSGEAGDALPEIDVDPERIMQVLSNLISNAVRHTNPDGTIHLQAQVHDNSVHLRVRDTGSGIAPQDMPGVFERFYRADRTRTQEGASGLGLPIARSIVEAHGGTIDVASTLGVGTTFTVALPIRSGILSNPDYLSQ